MPISRASGMRYQVSSTQPIRAQFEGNPDVCAVGKHPYPRPYAERLVRAQLAGGDVVGAREHQ